MNLSTRPGAIILLSISAVICAAVGLAFWVGLFSLWSRPSGAAADTANSQQVALGQEVYAANCASCHGENLEGQANWRQRNANGRLPAPPHDDSGHTWHHPDFVLFGITKQGPAKFANLNDYESDMPAYEGVLSDEEIWAVIAFIKSQWSPENQARQEQLNQAATNQ